jgi:hypothetical protein
VGTATANGFSATAQKVTIFVAQTRVANATLPPGSVNQAVTVEQSAVSVDTTTRAQAGTISGTQVKELELNNHNFQQLVTLQPWVPENWDLGLIKNEVQRTLRVPVTCRVLQ